jgi:hypothetical protein
MDRDPSRVVGGRSGSSPAPYPSSATDNPPHFTPLRLQQLFGTASASGKDNILLAAFHSVSSPASSCSTVRLISPLNQPFATTSSSCQTRGDSDLVGLVVIFWKQNFEHRHYCWISSKFRPG